MPASRQFEADLDASKQFTSDMVIEALSPLYGVVNGIRAGSRSEDMAGADWIADIAGEKVHIDTKLRRFAGKDSKVGYDSLPLEVYSQIWPDGRKVMGWTLDRKKTTDIVIWAWDDDPGRYITLFFRPLCDCFFTFAKVWSHEPDCFDSDRLPPRYNQTEGFGRTFQTRFINVPITKVLAAIAPFNQIRSRIAVPDGLHYCNLPSCDRPARYPQDQPETCYKHYKAMYPFVEDAGMQKRRLAMEDQNLKSRMIDLNESKARSITKEPKSKQRIVEGMEDVSLF